jgi:hypothetical protein
VVQWILDSVAFINTHICRKIGVCTKIKHRAPKLVSNTPAKQQQNMSVAPQSTITYSNLSSP